MRFAVWLKDGDGADGEEAVCVMLFMKFAENQCVPDCGKCKKSMKKQSHAILWKVQLSFKILTSALLV